MNVSVKVNVNGVLTFTDPEYNTGWNVNVMPDGIIDNKYDYLFYEADLNKMNFRMKDGLLNMVILKNGLMSIFLYLV